MDEKFLTKVDVELVNNLPEFSKFVAAIEFFNISIPVLKQHHKDEISLFQVAENVKKCNLIVENNKKEVKEITCHISQSKQKMEQLEKSMEECSTLVKSVQVENDKISDIDKEIKNLEEDVSLQN